MNEYIQIKNQDKIIIYKLNHSRAARDLIALLPLNQEVENYAHNEKITYLPKKIKTQKTPLARGGIKTLAYFEPWHNLVFYYDDFGPYPGLYELGQLVKGQENIKKLSGMIEISEYHEGTSIEI